MKHGIFFAAALALAGCRFRGQEPDGSGTIECTQVQVAAKVGGRLLRLPPQEGAAVTRGVVVAEIDPTDYRLRRDEAAALLGQAEAQCNLVRAGSRAEDIRRAEEEVRGAQAVADGAASERKRVDDLHARGSMTDKQFDDARAQADRTAAALAAAQQNLARLRAGSRPEEIRLAETQVEVARARQAQVEQALKDCTLLAPTNGVVTTRSHEPGEMTPPGATLLTLSLLDDVWLSVYIAETRLGKVRLGQPAQVSIDGDKRRFQGRVTFLSPEAEFTPKDVQTSEQRAKLVYRVKISLPNEERIFKPGMPADAWFGAP